MKSGPKQQLAKARAIRIARTLVATILALSFFATVLPLTRASAGLMACCIGKSGHESGSCSTGLLPASESHQPEFEIATGQEAPFADVEAGAGGEGHCKPEAPAATDAASDSAEESAPEAISASPEESAVINISALSRPCPADCGTCSSSSTWRPRPREQSALAAANRPRLPSKIYVSSGDQLQIKSQNTKWMQAPPRAPPV